MMRTSAQCLTDYPHQSLQSGISVDFASLFLDRLLADDVATINRMLADELADPNRRSGVMDFFAECARRLGQMWERDSCDFTRLTLAVYRLQQIVQRSAAFAMTERIDAWRVLLFTTEGEQHGFGLTIVADTFHAGGWGVSQLASAKRSQLMGLVKTEWFDVIGVSITSEGWLRGLASCIRAVRAASCNPAAFMMVGGGAVTNHPERLRFLGADATAASAADALTRANIFMEAEVTRRIHRFKTKTDDARLAL